MFPENGIKMIYSSVKFYIRKGIYLCFSRHYTTLASVMANSMCQLHWTKGCPGGRILLNE